MNVIEVLKKDHETVSRLFKSFESARDSQADREKELIVGRICEALRAHATVEEELFYPAVAARAQQQDEKAENDVKEAREEHALVKELVGELEEMSAGDENFDARVKVLKDVVEHHVEEEEGELMPRVKRLLSSEELDEIGSRVESRKQELEGQPAPVGAGAPRSASVSRARSSDSSRSASGSSSRSSGRTSRASKPARRRTSPRSR